jgi:hypothetical protein
MSDRERKDRKRAARRAAKLRHEQERAARQRLRQQQRDGARVTALTPEDEARARRVGAHEQCLFCDAPLRGGGKSLFHAGSEWAPVPVPPGEEFTGHLCDDCHALPQAEKDRRLAVLVGRRWLGVRIPRHAREKVANGLLARSAS